LFWCHWSCYDLEQHGYLVDATTIVKRGMSFGLRAEMVQELWPNAWHDLETTQAEVIRGMGRSGVHV